jgi:hypothetical protein
VKSHALQTSPLLCTGKALEMANVDCSNVKCFIAAVTAVTEKERGITCDVRKNNEMHFQSKPYRVQTAYYNPC